MEKLSAQMARRDFALYEFLKECQLKPDGIAESVKHITEKNLSGRRTAGRYSPLFQRTDAHDCTTRIPPMEAMAQHAR
jgi:hypothetical protein